MDYFVKITDEARVAMVVVTHDAATAERCSRKCLLADGRLDPY
jgi:putative ABC transport system ATP-binding protein